MNYLTDRVSEFVQDLIEGKKHLGAVGALLAVLACLTRILPMRAQRQRICDGRLYVACLQRDYRKAAMILTAFAKHDRPGADAMRLFFQEILVHIDAKHARTLQAARHFDPDLAPVLDAALLWADGKSAEALDKLDIIPKSFPARVQAAELKRAFLLEGRHHEQFAEDGIRRLADDADRQMFQYASSVAAAADSAGRKDLLRTAIERIARDRAAIQKSDRALSRYAQHAVDASMWLLDLEGAKQVIAALRRRGMDTAASRLERRIRLGEIEAMSPLIGKAHQDILARAGMLAASPDDADAVLVIPSAALRANKIDYPGFRADIRFVLQTIAAHLDALGMSYRVRGQVKLHGTEDLRLPFFAYHTVSGGKNGLHFKETDRPSRFSFDTGGYSGWSDFSKQQAADLPLADVDASAAEAYFRRDQQRIIANNISKYRQDPLDTQTPLPERFVFVALQMVGDSVQELAHFTPMEMLDEVIAACARRGYAVVVKRHPLCGSAAVGRYLAEAQSSGRITLASGSIHAIIARAAAVCVVNSGVGAEALLHEKPVYVFGRADYMGACFVCATAGDFDRQFQPGRSALSREELHRFWYLLRESYAVDLGNRDEAKKEITRRVDDHLRRVAAQGAIEKAS